MKQHTGKAFETAIKDYLCSFYGKNDVIPIINIIRG